MTGGGLCPTFACGEFTPGVFRNMRSRVVGAVAALLLVAAAPAGAQDCPARDFLAMALPTGDPVEVALETAYPGLDLAAGRVALPDGQSVAAEGASSLPPAERLDRATLGDQFAYPYQLGYDLGRRRTPWVDPGRLRNEAFFRALWFATPDAARASLAAVVYPGSTVTARFEVTTRHCAAAQLALALRDIAAMGVEMDRFFQEPGGSFNWRRIAGTDRLSVHSFGAAVDLNAALGGYWLWTGAAEGAVGDYRSEIPPALVREMERRGFIWGGKWHHYDGMHFEYRPELILHARLTGG